MKSTLLQYNISERFKDNWISKGIFFHPRIFMRVYLFTQKNQITKHEKELLTRRIFAATDLVTH